MLIDNNSIPGHNAVIDYILYIWTRCVCAILYISVLASNLMDLSYLLYGQTCYILLIMISTKYTIDPCLVMLFDVYTTPATAWWYIDSSINISWGRSGIVGKLFDMICNMIYSLLLPVRSNGRLKNICFVYVIVKILYTNYVNTNLKVYNYFNFVIVWYVIILF